MERRALRGTVKVHHRKSRVHQSPLEIARSYIKRRFVVIPIPHRKKKPILDRWPELRLTRKTARDHFGEAKSNIGVILGEPSRGLVDVDLDCPEAVSLAAAFLADTLRFGRASSRDSHWLYRISPAPKKREAFIDPVDKETMLEIRSTGGQTVLPFSTHPSGEAIEWSDDGDREPTTISAEALREHVVKLAAATLLVRHWPESGSRHDTMLALAGGLMTAGWAEDQAIDFIAAIASAVDDDEVDDRTECVRTTARKVKEGEPVLGWGKLAELLGTPIVRRVKRWLNVGDSNDGDDSGGKTSPTQSKDLIDFISKDCLFHSSSGVAYCEIDVGVRSEVHEVRSRETKRWLQRKCFATTKKTARGPALDDAIAILEAIALNDGEQREVALRVAKTDDALYLDLASPTGQIVKITSDGYSVLKKCATRFRRTRNMLSLPRPKKGGSIEELREFINVKSDGDWKLVIAWLTFAFLPKGPFPVLTLNGEEGTAKSTTEKVLREMIDPNTAPLRSRPRAMDELMIAAHHSWIVAFDNLSGVARDISDGICCLAYNGALTGRTLYTNQEEHVIAACRPVILNGIDMIATRGDLASRSIALMLPRISDRQRLTEEFFWERFELRRPFILGAILAAVSGGLRHLPDISLKKTPRMADFANWGAAIERALEWPEGSFEEAYAENRTAQSESVIESDEVASALRSFMGDRKKDWTGTAADLLHTLTAELGFDKPDRSWPRTPAALGNRLRRSAPALRAMGMRVTFQRDSSERRISLRLI